MGEGGRHGRREKPPYVPDLSANRREKIKANPDEASVSTEI